MAIYEVLHPQVLEARSGLKPSSADGGRAKCARTLRTGSICYSRYSKRGACGTGKAICHWFAHAVALHFFGFRRTAAADQVPHLPPSGHARRCKHRGSRLENGPPEGTAPAPKLTEGLHAWGAEREVVHGNYR